MQKLFSKFIQKHIKPACLKMGKTKYNHLRICNMNLKDTPLGTFSRTGYSQVTLKVI